MSKPMYRLVDGKGRVLIPKSMREAAKLEYANTTRNCSFGIWCRC